MLYKMTGQTYLQQVAEFIEAFRVDLSRTALGCPTSNCHQSARKQGLRSLLHSLQSIFNIEGVANAIFLLTFLLFQPGAS